MSKGNLFAASAAAKSKNIVEFKAGKMSIDDSNWVVPDKRKGLVYIYEKEGLTHFCWKDRVSGSLEDDLIVFPDDAEFRRIPECTTGRVYVLKLQGTKKLFFWLQEPKTDKDEEICKKVNDTLNSQTADTKGVTSKREVQELLANAADLNFSQSDLMSILGMESGLRDIGNESEGSSRVSSVAGHAANRSQSTKRPVEAAASESTPAVTTTPSTVASSSSNQKFKINELRSIFKTIQETTYGRVHVDLTDVVNSENVFPLLNNSENVKRLIPLLPNTSEQDTLSDTDYIKHNIQCPQMHAAVKSFGNAIQTGELAPVLSHFNLGENVTLAAQTGNMKEISKALELNLSKKNLSSITKEEKDEITGTTTPTNRPTEDPVQGDEAMEQD